MTTKMMLRLETRGGDTHGPDPPAFFPAARAALWARLAFSWLSAVVGE